MKIQTCLTALAALCALPVLAGPTTGLDSPINARPMLASSANPDLEENGDARGMAAGETLTITDVKGPGRINHIWFTVAANERAYGRMLVIRMYWDGEKTPSVECPMNDFFAEGHGMDMNVNSAVVTVTAEGRARNCYWPMPFRKSAKITVTNEGKLPVQALFWQVDWLKLKSLPRDTIYFHAQYRQNHPRPRTGNYTLFDAKGKGQLVGTVINVRMHEGGWFGEGDQLISIDGESRPSIQGTGSEDYWCDAWGLRPSQSLYYGFPISEGFSDAGSLHTAYRWHITDPIPFSKSISFQIETRGAHQLADGSWDGYARRADDFSSVAYWYQTEPHAAFPALPKAQDRVYAVQDVIEGESSLPEASHSVNAVSIQSIDSLSGGKQLWYTPKENGASLKLPIRASKPGRYLVKLTFLTSWDYGTWSVKLDATKPAKAIDLFASLPVPKSVNLGVFEFSSEPKELSLSCTGKNNGSQGYYLGLDSIELLPLSN
ncbi:MAG: glycoside hydrolase family 172 protein [Armatimonadota bacterium]